MNGDGSNYSESSSPNNNTIGTESVRVTDLEKVKAIQKSRWDGRLVRSFIGKLVVMTAIICNVLFE